MTLIVETGRAGADSEAYASVADADAHFARRGVTIWNQQTEIEKENALVRATDFMREKYRSRWQGFQTTATQALDWPRMGVVILGVYSPSEFRPDAIPTEVKKACVELALRASIGALNEDRSQAIIQETVGPITTKYDPYSNVAVEYTAIESLLSPLFKNNGSRNTMKLTRT